MPADGDATLDPDRIRSTGFSTAFRGYDQHEVRRYLERLAEALRAQRRSDPASDPTSASASRERVAGVERRAAAAEARVAELEATIAELRRDLAARAAPADGGERDPDPDQLQRRRAEAEREVEQLLACRGELTGALRAVRDQIDRAIGGLGAAGDDSSRPGMADRGPSSGAEHRAGAADQATPRPQVPRLGPPEAAALDALFSKVRADRSRAVADARHVLATDHGPGEQAAGPAAAGGHGAAGTSEPPASTPPDEVGPAAPTRPAAPMPGAEADTDEILLPIEREALRMVKRAMADAQSELLDLVGRSQGELGAGDLPDVAEQRRRYAEAAAGPVAAAFRAGVGAGGGIRAGTGVEHGVAGEVCSALAAQLAAQLADPLQDRVAAALGGSDEGPEATLERIRGHYREVRAVALGPLVAVALARAFAAGSASAGAGRAGRRAGG